MQGAMLVRRLQACFHAANGCGAVIVAKNMCVVRMLCGVCQEGASSALWMVGNMTKGPFLLDGFKSKKQDSGKKQVKNKPCLPVSLPDAFFAQLFPCCAQLVSLHKATAPSVCLWCALCVVACFVCGCAACGWCGILWLCGWT